MNTTGEVLRAFRAGRHGIVYAAPRRVRRPHVALTFDDGPSEWTAPILDILAAHEARATFFVLGSSVAGREDILNRAAAEGHELGNHGYSHADPATLSDDVVRRELDRTSAILEEVVGERPRHFRPPYGSTDFRVADVAQAAGLARTVLRSVDPADWKEPSADRIADRVLAGARRGAIVCLHDGLPPHEPRGLPTRQPTVDALGRIASGLRRRGYRLVTVTELLA